MKQKTKERLTLAYMSMVTLASLGLVHWIWKAIT